MIAIWKLRFLSVMRHFYFQSFKERRGNRGKYR
nr:MAG TPA: hypothetical protein [Caudoviricetes sp.]